MATPAVCYGGDSGGNNSVVECDLAKVEVAGSNPVSRSNLRSPELRASYGWRATLRAKGVHHSLGEGGLSRSANELRLASQRRSQM